jgi:hypothetical protein
MDVPLHSARAAGRILFLFGIKEFIHHRFMPSEHFSFKNTTLQMGSKTQNCNFFENDTVFIKFHQFMGKISLNETAGWYLQENSSMCTK